MIKDITGKKFGKLTVLNFDYNKHKWKCKCDCGKITYAESSRLRSGRRKSCGCIKGYNNLKDVSGKKFGRLTCLEYDYEKKKWLCLCDCGNTHYASLHCLNRGSVKSCGCLYKERIIGKGITKSPYYKKLYTIRKNMLQRCNNEKAINYKWYGGKGIKVCELWTNSMKNFYQWAIDNGYKEGLQIDRIDSNKDYCPENCRWVTPEENISRAGITEKMKILNETSTDEVVKKFALKKLEIMEKEKEKPKPKQFFFRKPTYSHLTSVDGTKRYIFRRQKDICLFLDISYGALNYRIHNKNGMIGDNWKYEKIDKEIFESYKRAGIEVIA